MKDTFKEIISESISKYRKSVVYRENNLDLNAQKPQSIIGPRRAGKTSLLRQKAQELLNAGYEHKNICFIGFEDERLLETDYMPDVLLQAFREYYPGNDLLKNVYFLFDEIQYLSKWEAFLNRLQETITPHIFFTGSNSKLLHTQIATVMRGRSLPVEFLPLSFKEFLVFNKVEYIRSGPHVSGIKYQFDQYLQWGGFPEVVLRNEDKISLLQEYFNVVLYRDILEENEINPSYLKYFFHRIAMSTGKKLAIRKMYAELKSRGQSVGITRLYELADKAEAVYLFKRIPKYDPSLIKRENSDKKGYFIDNGFLNAIVSGFSQNKGMLLENMIFWHLYRLYGNIYNATIFYYLDSSLECDFIVQPIGLPPMAIQVCYDMKDPKSRSREIDGLIKASKYIGNKKGILITLEEEFTIKQDGIEVHSIAAWKWCHDLSNLYLL